MTALAFVAGAPAQGQDPAPDALVRKSIDEVLVVIKADKELQNGNPKKITPSSRRRCCRTSTSRA